jgi:hypothetical protein
MFTKALIPAALLVLSTQSFGAMWIRCPETSKVVPEGKTIADYQSFFRANNIIPKTELTLSFVEQFKNEFEKFPPTLTAELIRAGNKIHIMEGTGVTADPTWPATDVYTFDGRPWSKIPGGGGSTARGYSITPTRIVINHLYDGQGSADMLLHEHAHSLDSIYDYHGISHSRVWEELLSVEPNHFDFMTKICGKYCTDNLEEGFAEYFANYHGCEQTRGQMEKEVPRIAEFFRRFTTTKNLDSIWDDSVYNRPEKPEAPAVQPENRPEQRQERRRGGIFRRLRDIFPGGGNG